MMFRKKPSQEPTTDPTPASPGGTKSSGDGAADDEQRAFAEEARAAIEEQSVERVVDELAAKAGTAGVGILTAEDVADALGLCFALVASARGPHWELTEPERERIGKWAAKAIERHGVDWLGKFLPDVCALSLLSYAILKRLQLDRALAEAISDHGAASA